MISSESNSQIKELQKLQKNARERKKSKSFVAEGIKITKEAALLGKLKRVYFSESIYEKNREEFDTAYEGIQSEIIKDSIFKEVSGTVTPQGVIGVLDMPEYDRESILENCKDGILLLDDLRDPGNLGTIIRTAEGAGMAGVVLSRESVDIFNPKVVRSTMGAIFRVPFCYVESIPEFIEDMKKRNIPVYGTMMEGSVIYDEPDYTGGCGIVIGNEANGISEKTVETLTARVKIPMGGKLESLNAAVAAAILMYEVSRQKRNN